MHVGIHLATGTFPGKLVSVVNGWFLLNLLYSQGVTVLPPELG